MSKFFTKSRLFFRKVPSIMNTLFPPLCETLYAANVNLFAESSELFLHAEVQLVIFRKRLPLSASFRGPKILKSDGDKSGLTGE